jgi:hypothetical protein
MHQIFVGLSKEIEELRLHIEYIKNVPTQIKSKSKLVPYINSLTKKKFNYNSLIITLYGIVESYSEKIIKNYLLELSTIVKNYNYLSTKIQEQHLIQTANLSLRVIEAKTPKYSHLDPFDIIRNIYSCINCDPNYTMNYDSFIILSGNLKHQKICELFKQVDIDLDNRLKALPDFNKTISENHFNKIDELVVMRNEIAHGSTSTLLNPLEIEGYVEFVSKYFRNLKFILTSNLEQEKLKYIKNHESIILENALVFGGNIVGFSNVAKNKISVKNNIIVEKDKGKLFFATMLEIKKKRNLDVTFKLNVNIRQGNKFYLVR